jgi:uncharacterized protein YqfB (UPF0267 family)
MQMIFEKKMDIQERNFLFFSINENSEILLKGDRIVLSEVRDIAKTFIANPKDLNFLPEKKTIDIPDFGLYAVTSNAVIQVEISRKANYQAYISVLSELTAAYNELRNELAIEKFQRPFVGLTEEQKTAIRTVYPLRISEKELQGKEVLDE